MNIVYAMTRNVYEWIIPSIRSLHNMNPNATVYILCEDDSLPFDLPIPATIINVSGQTYFPMNSVNYNNPYTYINLLKVCYADYLPCEKVIHLDLDTIVCEDLQPMWNTDMSGKWVAAVPEKPDCWKPEGWKPFGEKYYNMGVALINLEQMRKDDIQHRMVHYLNTVKQPFADQDAWNKYGSEYDKFVDLPLRYNEGLTTGTTDYPAIVHYCCIRHWYFHTPYRPEYIKRWKS